MNGSNLNLEEKLTEYVANVTYDDLPAEAVDYCKLLLMDTLGVAFPGSRAPGCPEITELAGMWAVDAGASVLIRGSRTTPPLAAMANSAMMHALDFDDTLDASALHTFVTVLPAALAVAENRGTVSGRQLITALVLGVDLVSRISLGIRRPLSWIRTATCGAFGAAAAAAKLMELDRTGIANALGVVYSQVCGNAQGLIEGRLVKRLQPGFAASAGVLSAFLAQRGITGSGQFLCGSYGYYNLYERGVFEPEPVLADLGVRPAILDLSIKPYPSCRMTHASIDAALAIQKRIGTASDAIERVEISASKMVAEMVGKPFVIGSNPQVDAQFSIPYTVSCALVRGDVFLGDFESGAINDSRLLDLAGRVNVAENPDLPDNDLFHAHVVVRCSDGTAHESGVEVPLGNPAKAMNAEKCKEKFRKCVAYSGIEISDQRLKDLLVMIENLEEIRDVVELIGLMRV